MTDDDVLTAHDVLRRTAHANRSTVSRILEHVDVSAFHEKATYVRADRADGYPPLRIASGWVNGFTDRDEAIAAGGPGLVVWQSDERAPLWGCGCRRTAPATVAPVTDRRAAQQPCPDCGDLMPLTNVCDTCS